MANICQLDRYADFDEISLRLATVGVNSVADGTSMRNAQNARSLHTKICGFNTAVPTATSRRRSHAALRAAVAFAGKRQLAAIGEVQRVVPFCGDTHRTMRLMPCEAADGRQDRLAPPICITMADADFLIKSLASCPGALAGD